MAKYNSKYELLRATDAEIKQFFRDVKFMGVFDYYIPNEHKELFCGKITNITIDGETNSLCPQSLYVPQKYSSYVKKGNCEFSCSVILSLLRGAKHTYKLQIIHISNVEVKEIKSFDIREETFFKRNLRLRNNLFIGLFTENVDGSFTIRDIRRSDFSKLILQNGKDQQPIVYHPKRKKPEDGKYYEFSWVLNGANKEEYVYHFKVDESKPIQEISAFELIKRLKDDIMGYPAGAGQKIVKMLDTLKNQLTASGKEIFIYELLQNANDYPYKENGFVEKVNVEFHITRDSLVFMHSGAVFNERNIAAICSINDKEKTDNKETIGYKGIGFKTVFLDNNYVYLQTGEFSFRFDREESRDIVDTPWQILPIWTNYNELTPSEKYVFTNADKQFRVKFALRPTNSDTLRGKGYNYVEMFKNVFKNERVILFIPNLSSVKIFYNGTSIPDIVSCCDNNHWQVNDFKHPVPVEVTESINADIDKQEDAGTLKIPTKYYDFTQTKISFACEIEGAQLKEVEDTNLYCYLPTKASWGFKFLMNTDMIPTGPRDDVEVDFSDQININAEISEIAGKKFFDWIKCLCELKKYKVTSIFNLIPVFETNIREHGKYKQLIERFKLGFDTQIENEELIPIGIDEYAKVSDIILDETGIMSMGIMSDDEFYTITGYEGSLPVKILRTDRDFKAFIRRYLKQLGFENNIWDFDDLKEACSDPDFCNWVSIQENNDKFLDFLLKKSKLKEFLGEKIFIAEGTGELYCANKLYYDVESYIDDLKAFESYIPHLSLSTKAYFTNNEDWDDVIKGAFAEFNCEVFVDNILLLSDNISTTKAKLNDRNTSIHFFKFLSENVAFKENYLGLPFIDDKGKVVNDFREKIIFLSSEDGHKVFQSKWLSSINIAFLSDKYTDASKKYLCEHFGAKTFTDSFVINDIILSVTYHDLILNSINKDIVVNKAFVDYIFDHKESVKGVEITNGTEKSINYCRFNDYGLFFVSGTSGIQSFMVASDEKAFIKIKSDYLNYGWFDKTWIYLIADSYYVSKNEEDIKQLNDFFHKYFGLSEMNDTRFRNIVKQHLEAVKKSITSNIDLNISFWSFMSKFQWTQNSKDLETYKTLPFIDENGNDVDVTKRKNLFYFENELLEIRNSIWMPDSLVTILSHRYDAINGKNLLLDLFGFKKYDPQKFASFFEEVIVNQTIPNTIPPNISITQYGISLDTEEKCIAFHNFMSKKYTLLNDIDKALLKGTPIYVYGKAKKRRLNIANNLYLLGDDKFNLLDYCSKGLLPEIDAVDSVNSDNQKYWIDVMGCVQMDESELCLWIENNASTINLTLQNRDKNIQFWTWLFSLGGIVRAKIGKLKALPVIYFNDISDGKEEGVSIASISVQDIYMSNPYMGQAPIEDFARKHGKKNFLSSVYLKDNGNADEWRKFFRQLGVKDDVKDVIHSVIMTGLPTLKDKKFPWVLVDQYSKEIADPEKWKELAPKLTELQVETTTIGSFVSIANALRVTVDDYSQKEPFKMVKLDGEISREYYDDENVKNLINKIAEYAKSKKITEFQQWIDAKIDRYLLMQESTQSEEFKNIHFKFIQDWLGHKDDYIITRSHDIKLYDRDNNLTKSEFLFLGSSYDCKCDFERFNISKTYVSDDYLNYGKSRDVTYLLRTFIGCRDRFKKEDINCLIDKDFSIYFWCKYVGSKDITIKAEINALVNEGAFNEVRCIPSQSGLMKKASELYSSSLKDYMKYIPDYQEKIIDPKMQFSEPLIELCKQCMETLLVNDCIDFLINSKPKNRNRTKVLEWLLDSTSEDKDDLLQKYRSHEKACWLNGQNEPSHLSSLFAIDPNNCNQAYVFKSSSRVIDMSYLPMGMELDVCEMLEIPVFSDDDLVPNPVKTPDGGQTLMVSKEITRRLLLVIAYRYKDEWAECFDILKEKLEDVKFWLCESISYGYEDLSIDNEDFYYDPISKTFYYVDSWQDKKVYESFVKKLCEYLNMDLDYRECKGKLDENFNRKKVARYLNSNCKDLFVDENFMSLINTYWKDVVELLEIEQDHESDGDEEEEQIEHVDIEKYYEDEPLDDDEEQDDGEEEVEEVGITHYPPASSGGPTSAGSNGVASPKDNPPKEKEAPTSNPIGGKPDGNLSSGHTDRPNSPKEQGKPSTAQSGSPNSYGRTGSRQSGQKSSSQHRRPNYLEPKVATKEEIQRFKYKTSTKTFTTRELQAEEHDAINRILGDGLTAEQIVTQNYLAQLRFWGSLKDNDLTLVDSISLEDFIRDSEDDKDYELTNGKYIHRCSAAGGILYVSPSIWNMVSDDRCIICVFVGAKVDEFFYIRNKQDLLDWIADDAILIKLTGDKKVEAVNTLYSEILMDTKGTAYTMIRVAYDEAYNPLFVDLQNNDVSQPKINDDEYGD